MAANPPTDDEREQIERAKASDFTAYSPHGTGFGRINGTLDGQIMAFFVMVAAAEVVVGLAAGLVLPTRGVPGQDLDSVTSGHRAAGVSDRAGLSV